jgi:hypothetical protein
MSMPPALSHTEAKPSRRIAWQVAAVLLVLSATLWHLHVINRAMPPCKADLVAVWKGTQAALRGQNPYLDATTIDIQRFYYGRPLTPADHVNPMGYAYPMHTILLFAPIAPLPWSIVRPLFLVLLSLVTVLSIPLWLQVAGLKLQSRQVVFTTAICLVSWPSMWAIHQIQPTLIVAFLLAGGCCLLQRGNAAAAGVLFACATIKPQLVAVLLLWLFLWAALRHAWRFFVSFGITLSVLLAVSFWMLPGWVTSWRQAGAEYAVYRHLRLDLQSFFGNTLGLVIAAAVAALSFILLWRYRRSDPSTREFGLMCALALAVTLCILPSERAMTYNYVLLFPAGLIVICTQPRSEIAVIAKYIALIPMAWSFVTIFIAVYGETRFGPSNFWDGLPCATTLLPATVLLALVSALSEDSLNAPATAPVCPEILPDHVSPVH